MQQQVPIGQAQALPFNVSQQAGMYQLGTLVTTYQPLFTSPISIIGMIIVTWVLDAIVIAIALAFNYVIYFTVILPFAVLIYGIYAMFHCKLRVYQFSAGLVQTKDNEVAVIRWDQVEAVWQKITRSRYRTAYTYSVRMMDGKTFRFGNMLRQVSLLGQNIQQEVARIHMPRALTAYNAGQQLYFGPLSLSSYGINNGREQLPWNQVQGTEVKRGYLNIKKANKTLNWAHVAVATIPNFHVLLEVVNYARSGQK